MNGWNVPITHLERNMIFQTSQDYVPAVNLQGCKPAGRFQKSFLFGIFISKKTWRVGIVDLQRYLRWKSQPGKLHQKIDGLPLKGGHHGGGWFLKENKHKTQDIYSVLCSWRVWHAGETHFCSSWQQTPTKIKKTKHDLHKTCTGIKTAQNKNMQSIHPQPWVDAQSFTFFVFWCLCRFCQLKFSSYPHHGARFWECSEKGSEQEGWFGSGVRYSMPPILSRFLIVR